ncbi:MAG: NUDIX domain-containing protein [Bacteroidota bacterium]
MSDDQAIRVSVDAVVFGYTSEEGLSLLLIKRAIEPFAGYWALPGGLVSYEETLEAAVERELHEETGISINYLEQLYTFGALERDPRNRVISVAYYGLVKPSVFQVKAATDANEVAWFNVNHLPELAFDHRAIIEKAIERLRGKIVYQPIGFELLEKRFPFSELEKLYGAVLGKPVDRRNFKKKIMRFGFVKETNERQALKGAGRPGYMYEFDEHRYFELVQQGINIEL